MGIPTLALGGIVIIGVVILVVAGLIAGITLWITGGQSKGSGEMSCGACGYPVRGLQALNCPECGADLRIVGINRAKGSAATGVGIALTAVCALLILGCLGSLFLWMDTSSVSAPAVPSQIPSPSFKQQPTGQPFDADPPEIEDEQIESPSPENPSSPEQETP